MHRSSEEQPESIWTWLTHPRRWTYAQGLALAGLIVLGLTAAFGTPYRPTPNPAADVLAWLSCALIASSLVAALLGRSRKHG